MRKGLLVGLGAALAVAAVGITDAAACSRRVGDCGYRAYAPPVGYTYVPVPVAPVYGYAPPPSNYYYAPRRRTTYRWNGYGFGPPRAYYGAAHNGGYYGYGYGGYRNCGRGYGYAPTYDYDNY